MNFSYTQISRYLSCPKSYRYRYIEGWKEKETRAQMAFGRAFEIALGAFFRREDSVAALYDSWREQQKDLLLFGRRDSWDKMLQQGTSLLHLFGQSDRVRIDQPGANLQIKYAKALDDQDEFVAYVDAVGTVDGEHCIIDWKTTSQRYSEEPAGLLSLDPQLICYSWITGISDAALIVFVRKSQPEIQYLHTRITEEARSEYATLVKRTIASIKQWDFPAHSGVRFPFNTCSGCSYLGLCLKNSLMTHKGLIREPGGDLGWLDELSD
jgi:CRISPR/Cas system-associated exonuclease Cas4 (RecB family)